MGGREGGRGGVSRDGVSAGGGRAERSGRVGITRGVRG